MKKIVILVSIILILFSCKKDIPSSTLTSKITGKWYLVKLFEYNLDGFSTFNTDSIIYNKGSYIDFRTDGKAYYFSNNTPSTPNIHINQYDTNYYKYNDSIGYVLFWRSNSAVKDSFIVTTINQTILNLYNYSNYGLGYLKTWLYCNR